MPFSPFYGRKATMKLILHVIVGLRTGGAELMLKRLVLGHRSEVYRHAVISLTDLGSIGQELRDGGIEVYTIGMSRYGNHLRAIIDLYKLIKLLRPFVVQTWMYHSDLLGGLVGRVAGAKRILWGIRTSKIARSSRLTRLLRRVSAAFSYFLPTRIICCADSARKLHEEIGYDRRKFVVVPNGFDEKPEKTPISRDELRAKWGLEPCHILIGSVARNHPIKGHIHFVAAAARVASKHPHARFVLIGRDVNDLTDLIRQTGYSERFIVLGERSDVNSCLKTMDVFCLHSLSEGFPNALGEAMLASLPCVTTDVGDARLLLGNGGMVVPSADPKKLGSALDEMLRLSTAHRVKIGEFNKNRIEQQFSMKKTILRFESIYNELV